MEQATELAGTVERVIYENEENGYSVFVLKVNARDTITVCGVVGSLHQGSQLVVKGVWSFHPKFGRQLEASECVSSVPTTVIGIEKYLASGLIKGIGPKFAERLVKKFGDQTLEVIDKQPQLLKQVGGIGPARVEAIITAWQDQREISRVMVFLRSKDVSPAYAVKIFKTYGNQAIDKIQENPYRLVDDIWGVGFKTADGIALKMGLEKHSPLRIKAGILHSVAQATDLGSLYVEIQQLKKEAAKHLELDEAQASELIKQALTELYQQERVKLISHADQHYLSLPQFYFSEKGIASRINKILEFGSKIEAAPIDTIYRELRVPDDKGFMLNEDQQRGIIACLSNKITVITGGPGTGKTTLIKSLLSWLDRLHVRFRLAAPTGRAAKRMFESTGRSTETLHRLLEFSPASMSFTKKEDNALDLDVLIVDEASMIDVFLMLSVLKALPLNSRLILIGDVDQLPSVGAGNVLHDLIASEKVPVVRLTQIFRQARNSMIIVNAHRVNRGEFPQSSFPEAKKDFFYVKEDVPENIFPLLRSIYTTRLPKLGLSVENSIVLVPMNRGVVGTQRLNQELQMILNPERGPNDQVMQFGQAYRLGDRVMQIRNNYEKFVFNGDIGKITAINKEDQVLTVSFGDRDVPYDFAEINELVLSYAVSIHKSQGSEFDVVIIPIFMQHFILLQRNLIYTAITRAKKMCILVGQAKAIAMGIRNVKGNQRLTFLKEFLTTDLAAR